MDMSPNANHLVCLQSRGEITNYLFNRVFNERQIEELAKALISTNVHFDGGNFPA